MPSLPTSRECFYRLAYYKQMNQQFVFCDGRTPQLTLLCFNTRVKFSGLRSRFFVPPTMHYNAMQEAMRSFAEAASAVLENCHIDNYLDSVNSREVANNRLKKSVHPLHLGGIKLTKLVNSVQNLVDKFYALFNLLIPRSLFHATWS